MEPFFVAGERRFYIAVGILVVLICLAGFGPSIIDPTSRNLPLPMTALVATHAIASAAWILLFLVQTTLVATGLYRHIAALGWLDSWSGLCLSSPDSSQVSKRHGGDSISAEIWCGWARPSTPRLFWRP